MKRDRNLRKKKGYSLLSRYFQNDNVIVKKRKETKYQSEDVLSLYPDILDIVVSFLGPSHQINLARCSKTCHAIVANNLVYKSYRALLEKDGIVENSQDARKITSNKRYIKDMLSKQEFRYYTEFGQLTQ